MAGGAPRPLSGCRSGSFGERQPSPLWPRLPQLGPWCSSSRPECRLWPAFPAVCAVTGFARGEGIRKALGVGRNQTRRSGPRAMLSPRGRQPFRPLHRLLRGPSEQAPGPTGDGGGERVPWRGAWYRARTPALQLRPLLGSDSHRSVGLVHLMSGTRAQEGADTHGPGSRRVSVIGHGWAEGQTWAEQARMGPPLRGVTARLRRGSAHRPWTQCGLGSASVSRLLGGSGTPLSEGRAVPSLGPAPGGVLGAREGWVGVGAGMSGSGGWHLCKGPGEGLSDPPGDLGHPAGSGCLRGLPGVLSLADTHSLSRGRLGSWGSFSTIPCAPGHHRWVDHRPTCRATWGQCHGLVLGGLTVRTGCSRASGRGGRGGMCVSRFPQGQ